MRAARRLIVLAGILATVVFAPVTWSQAGAQTQGDGETPPKCGPAGHCILGPPYGC